MTGKGPTRSAVIPLGLSDPHSPFPAWFNSWANSPNLCCARSCEEHRESLYLPGKSTVFCSGNSVTSCRQLIWRKFLPILPFARTASLCMFLPSLPTFGWCATWVTLPATPEEVPFAAVAGDGHSGVDSQHVVAARRHGEVNAR